MKRTDLLTFLLMLFAFSSFAQFHTLKIPKASQNVIETQTLGVTDITITYGSPALRGRNVWENIDIIPQEGNPIAWRAGANLATTISFSTDVMIEGKSLKAGEYGFHIIPKKDNYTLLFVQPAQQWGSYYLDVDKDAVLKVNVNSESCAKSEQLDYEFLNRTENSLVVGLEWDEKRIPFKVEVDLNKTVIESFRSELRGINTYHWQAWNDAALWCLNHNTNLEEALKWANRSINGGYNGFAGNENSANTITKLRLLKKLGKTTDFDNTIKKASEARFNNHDINEFNIAMLRFGKHKSAYDYSTKYFKMFPNQWSLLLNRSIAAYFLGKQKQAVKDVEKVITLAPKQFEPRLKEIIKEFKTKTFKLTPY